MKLLTVILSIAFLPSILAAQETLLVSGKVFKENSTTPIAWCSIGVKGRPVGTVAGDDGSFEFHIPSKYINDELVISNLGYKQLILKVIDAVAKGNTIFYLEEEAFMLPEMQVLSKELSAHQIIKRASAAIRKNYAIEPYLLNAFYRDHKKVNGKYVSLLEAAVSIYDNGYHTAKSEKVSVVEIRRSKRYVNEYEPFVSSLNLLGSLLGTNYMRHRRGGALSLRPAQYKLDAQTIIDNQVVYVINTVGVAKFKIYVRASDYGVLRIEQNSNFRDTLHVNNYKANDSIYFKIISIQSYLDFRTYNNKLYLNYINYQWTTENINLKTSKVITTTDFFQELMPNLIQTEQVVPPPPSAIMADTSLELQTKKYNKVFWSEYNMVQQNPIDKAILDDLSDERPLSNQFEKPEKSTGLSTKKKKKRRN